MTESPIDPDNAAIARRLERRPLESAVVLKAILWWSAHGHEDTAPALSQAVGGLVAFDLAHPEPDRVVSPPARAAAGPDPEAPLSAAPGPAATAEALRPGAFPLCGAEQPNPVAQPNPKITTFCQPPTGREDNDA